MNTGHRWTTEEELFALVAPDYSQFAALYPDVSEDAYRVRRGALMRRNTIREELRNRSRVACKVCAFLASQPADLADAWTTELARPPRGTDGISHIAVVDALRDRGIEIDEASVRRHRRNHGK